MYKYEATRQQVIDWQLDQHGYTFCEHCQKSNGVYKFEVHHIIFRSEAPKHEHLHNPKNLIILCSDCHNGNKNSFHSNKDKRNYLIEKRKLDDLFLWLKQLF